MNERTEYLWSEFNRYRDLIHHNRRTIFGVPPDHWEIVEKVAIEMLVAGECNKLKAIHEEEIKKLKSEIAKYSDAIELLGYNPDEI